MTTYKVLKGWQMFLPPWFPKFNLGKVKNFKGIEFAFILSKELLYTADDLKELGSQADDHLKICGLSFYNGWLGWMNPRNNNRDACLLTFRSDQQTGNSFESFPYVNQNRKWKAGKQGVQLLPGKKYQGRIIRIRKNQFKISIAGENGSVENEFEVNERKRLKVLAPYHGGDPKARRTATIKMDFRLITDLSTLTQN